MPYPCCPCRAALLPPQQDFDYQPWHQISAAAKGFVGRLLDKDPSRRCGAAPPPALATRSCLPHCWALAAAPRLLLCLTRPALPCPHRAAA